MFYDANIGKDGEKGRTWLGDGAMILVAVFASSPVAMLTAEGFGFFGAAVDEGGTVNHTLLIPPPVWFDNVMVGYMPLVEQMLPSKPGIHLS